MIDLTKKYRTRNGKDVELISDKGRGDFPILGYFEGREALATWTQDGRYTLTGNTCSDLIEVKEMKKVWVVLFQRPSGELFTTAHSSAESVEAQLNYTSAKHIKTVEIEYEVGG
jgi:hypothetical protein